MRNFAKQLIAVTVSAGALTCVGIGAAAAADVVPYSQQRPIQPEYYPPVEEGYYREAPPAYVYPAPRPVYRYYYEEPEVAILPPPIYGRPYYGPRYPRYYERRVAREYGPYGRPWDYRRW